MSFVQTVLGPVDPERIGPTDCHAHLFIEGGAAHRHPDFRLADYPKIAADTKVYREAGGSAVVEMSPIDWGRDVESMARLSRETGVHVIAATGFHKAFYYPDNHWMYKYSEDEIAELIRAELVEGMDVFDYSGPIVRRAPARAGVIKVGTQAGRFSTQEEKLLRAAARAHLATGAPICAHTDEGALALEQVEYLGWLGVPAGKIALSRVDRRSDLGYHQELARTGAYLEYDAFDRGAEGLDAATLELVVKMAEAGFADRLLLGGPGLIGLVRELRARLREVGLGEADLQKLYVDNPRALLTWATPRDRRYR